MSTPSIPRSAIYRGSRVRVISYDNNRFIVLDNLDRYRSLTRDQLTFVKQ